jgi:uncharacterized protein (DUF885 family)
MSTTASTSASTSAHPIFALSSRFVDEVAALRPMRGTYLGVPGSDDRWGELGMAGVAADEELLRRTRDELASLPPTEGDHWAEVARRVLAEQLDDGLESIAAGDHYLDLNHLASTVPGMRSLVELQGFATAEQASDLLTRLETIGAALEGWWSRIDEGRREGRLVAKRQVRALTEQLRRGVEATGAYQKKLDEVVAAHPDLTPRCDAARAIVAAACNETARRLEEVYLPDAPEEDGVGIERYRRNSRRFLGTDLDLEATYAWGWERIALLRTRAHEVARRIDPTTDLDGVLEQLRSDPAYAAPSQAAFRDAMQERQEIALAKLTDVHFDVPAQIRKVTVNTVAPGAPLAAWYNGPSEDFSREGTIWWSLGDAVEVPLFDQVSTAYHEGFPGHHLQIGLQVSLSDRLSRAHRLLAWRPGYGEGWALYAEQFMDEIGELERPEYELGYLGTSLMRAVRVVVDLGLHLGLPIPADAPLHAGESWDYERAVEALTSLAFLDEATARSEVTRYLGWPGQAISYAVGQRAILELREERRARDGAGFDLKAFHADVLGSGCVGLDHLRELVLAG